MEKKMEKLKRIAHATKTLYDSCKMRWKTPVLTNYIADYMNKHPNKKMNWFLRKKLTYEFYRSMRKQNK